jgi:hypothetical protein
MFIVLPHSFKFNLLNHWLIIKNQKQKFRKIANLQPIEEFNCAMAD